MSSKSSGNLVLGAAAAGLGIAGGVYLWRRSRAQAAATPGQPGAAETPATAPPASHSTASSTTSSTAASVTTVQAQARVGAASAPLQSLAIGPPSSPAQASRMLRIAQRQLNQLGYDAGAETGGNTAQTDAAFARFLSRYPLPRGPANEDDTASMVRVLTLLDTTYRAKLNSLIATARATGAPGGAGGGSGTTRTTSAPFAAGDAVVDAAARMGGVGR